METKERVKLYIENAIDLILIAIVTLISLRVITITPLLQTILNIYYGIIVICMLLVILMTAIMFTFAAICNEELEKDNELLGFTGKRKNVFEVKANAITSTLLLVNVVCFIIESTGDGTLVAYQKCIILFVVLRILSLIATRCLYKLVFKHSLKDNIIRSYNNDSERKKLVEEYIDIIDSLQLFGDINKGELARERRQIEKYYYIILT